MVVSPQCKIPFIISEVISDKTEKDRFRMLVEAIALARVGHFLLQPTSKKTFFVVAIYVNAKMVVTRYIVIQTEGRDTGEKPVCVFTIVVMCYLWKWTGLHPSEKLRPPSGRPKGRFSARDVQSDNTDHCISWRPGPREEREPSRHPQCRE
jgi:hypothetical protein